jgi:hypothetical protein
MKVEMLFHGLQQAPKDSKALGSQHLMQLKLQQTTPVEKLLNKV